MDNEELYRMIKQAILENGEDVKQELRKEFKKEINELRTEMNTRFEEVNTRFEEVNTRFEEVNTRFDKIDVDMDYLKSKFLEHDNEIYRLKRRIFR